MSSDEFFRNMVAALAPIDAGVSPEEFGRAASPWLDAMTPTELQDLAVGLDATLADRGDQEQVQTDGHRRSA